MRTGRSSAFTCAAIVIAGAVFAHAAGQVPRKPLGPDERTMLLALIGTIDSAQQREAADGAADARMSIEHHILKSRDQSAYIPFRVAANAAASPKSALLYVRAVSRHDGFASREEHSPLRDWLARGGDRPLPRQETVFIGPGEMPVGGPASSSSRRAIQGPAEASTVLTLQQREYERQKAAEDASKKRAETHQRDPYLFPFEEYYFVDAKSARPIERALSLPAGEFDLYFALLDRDRAKTTSPVVVKRTVTVPDYWNDSIALSSLMLVSSINTLNAPLPALRQIERPYTFGIAEIVLVKTTTFSAKDALSVVFQICNYGAPDSDLTVEYNFYTGAGGTRRLFNHTTPQQLTDADLPPPSPWETQAFTSQSVPLHTFPPGRYELEVTVRDRLTRGVARQSVSFTVQ